MIKANELVWEEFGGFIRAESIHGAFYEIYTERLICALLFGKGDRIWSCECKALEEAKAACQAHYQQMTESMVDMGHLKSLIEDAVSFGFKRGIQCERARRNNSRHFEGETDEEREQRVSEFPGQEKLLSLAQEVYLKTLERKEEI